MINEISISLYNESLWYFHWMLLFKMYILTNLLYHTESILDSIQDSKLSLRKFQDSRTCTRLLTTLLKLFVTSCTSLADLQMHINTLKHLKQGGKNFFATEVPRAPPYFFRGARIQIRAPPGLLAWIRAPPGLLAHPGSIWCALIEKRRILACSL